MKRFTFKFQLYLISTAYVFLLISKWLSRNTCMPHFFSFSLPRKEEQLAGRNSTTCKREIFHSVVINKQYFGPTLAGSMQVLLTHYTWLLEKIFIQESTTKKLSIKKNWNHSPDLLHMEQSWDEIACILKCRCCCLKCLIIYNLIFFFQNYIHMFLFNWFNVQRISPFYNIFITEIVNDNLSYDTLPGLF